MRTFFTIFLNVEQNNSREPQIGSYQLEQQVLIKILQIAGFKIGTNCAEFCYTFYFEILPFDKLKNQGSTERSNLG